MSKFEGLTHLLAAETLNELVLTFAEIEKACDVELPASARRPQYWANQVENARGANKAAREGGFCSFLLAGQDKVRFARH